jgi:hypothetical protein
MVRLPTNEAWLFSKASGAWSPVKYSSEAVPCTRLVAQCVVVGDKLWLIGEFCWRLSRRTVAQHYPVVSVQQPQTLHKVLSIASQCTCCTA